MHCLRSFRKVLLLTAFTLLAFGMASAQCTLDQTDPSVTICEPADGATVSSPVHIVAGSHSSSTVDLMQIYLDHSKVYEVQGSSLDTSLSMADGTHRVTVQGHNTAGQWFNKTVNITVGSSSGGGCTPATDPGVAICEPTEGATVDSPVHVVATSQSSASPVTLMQIYVDGVKQYEVNATSIDTNLAMAAGARRVTVQAKDSAGQYFHKTVNITVGSSSGGGCTPSTDPGVAICEPTEGATVDSPVHVVATSQSSASPVTLMQIYVDGAKKYEVNATSIDTNLAMAAGARRVTVQAKDSAGQYFHKTVNITVSGTTNGGLSNLNHIIFYVQENRPMDQYFGRFGAYRQSHGFTDPFDSLPLSASLPDYSGTKNVSPFHFGSVCIENLSPGWNESHYSYHNGAMDYFMKASGSIPSSIDPQGTRAMGYYDQTELNYYYALALAYATSDRWFSSVMAPTIPNRMYLFAATSFGHIRPDSPPSGGWTQPTIFRKLQDAGVSWKYYYQDNSVFLAQWSDWSTLQSHVVNISQYYTDLQDGTLPQVVFIERASQIALDEHPGGPDLQKGAANTKKIIDALMHSSAWGSSVFILTFDEGGGFYDHVKPAPAVKPDSIAPMWRSTDIKADFDQTGFRVPFIIVSPWVKPHFVSHTVRDNTAILKLIETRFGLSALTARDAAQDDMTEFFDFNNSPRLTLPSLPAQSTSATCDKTKEKAPGF